MNTTELVVENKNWKKFRQLTLYMRKLTVEPILNYRFEYSQTTLDCKADHFEGNCFVFITSVGQGNIWESREGLDIRLSAFYVPRFVGQKLVLKRGHSLGLHWRQIFLCFRSAFVFFCLKSAAVPYTQVTFIEWCGRSLCLPKQLLCFTQTLREDKHNESFKI